MKNKTDFEEEGLIWTSCLQFSSSWKDREYNVEAHLFFIEKYLIWFYEKKLWEIMAEKGFSTHLIRTVQSVYQNT